MSAEIKDPLGLRDVLRFVDALESGYVGEGKALSGVKVKEMRSILEQFQDALEALDVVVLTDHPTKELGARCLSIGQAFARGEGKKLDEEGFLVLGDIATELADALYAYATEE